MQFQKDFFHEIMKMLPLVKVSKKKKKPEDIELKDLETLDFEVFFNIAWVMAKTANPSIPEPLEWLDQFEEFPIADILPQLQDLLEATLQTTKKK